jgi:hypothetical protein
MKGKEIFWPQLRAIYADPESVEAWLFALVLKEAVLRGSPFKPILRLVYKCFEL